MLIPHRAMEKDQLVFSRSHPISRSERPHVSADNWDGTQHKNHKALYYEVLKALCEFHFCNSNVWFLRLNFVDDNLVSQCHAWADTLGILLDTDGSFLE